MQKNDKAAFLAISFIFSAMGAGAGTFAWFQVTDKTSAATSGAVRGVGSNVEVGFRFTRALTSAEMNTYHFTLDNYQVGGSGYVYWTNNSIEGETFDFIVSANGYAENNVIAPMTSGAFASGDALALYQRSDGGLTTNPRQPFSTIALPRDYVAFDILFRVVGDDTGSDTLGYHVYFDYGTAFEGTQNVLPALRMGFHSSAGSGIIAPGYETTGLTSVGGRMDLDGNGLFDATRGANGQYYETAYGDFAEALTSANWSDATGNGTAATQKNDYFFEGETGTGIHPLINDVPSTAAYAPILSYQTEGSPMATTGLNGIAEAKYYIWLEGWDHACINSLSSAEFSAQLKFVIQR